jgi:hypothetical protein
LLVQISISRRILRSCDKPLRGLLLSGGYSSSLRSPADLLRPLSLWMIDVEVCCRGWPSKLAHSKKISVSSAQDEACTRNLFDHQRQSSQGTMAACQKVTKPLARFPQNIRSSCQSARAIRSFTSSSQSNNEIIEGAAETTITIQPMFDPQTVTSLKGEKTLMKQGIMPIGSRRRRAAIKSSDNIPFEQLPYQCFQEARKVLQADREEKLKLIATERLRISNLKATDASQIKGGQIQKDRRLDSMGRHLEYLKIQADINDPLIKMRFEDGEGM